MKDYALELAASKSSSNAKRNVMREYLQAYILKILHKEEFFQTAAFLGGTALRFLHGLPRFSEDLDFSLEKKGSYSLEDTAQKIKRELDLAGFHMSVTYREERTVQNVSIKFEELLYEAGLSPVQGQKFFIKIELDTNPPQGATLETKIVNKFFPMAFLSHDLLSLFAGKLIALFVRKYTKGRDFFDLGWYLSRWKDLFPNIALLQNALRQTDWKGKIPSEADWRDLLYGVVEKADWKKVKQDVENFLENPADLDVFTQSNVLQLLKDEREIERKTI